MRADHEQPEAALLGPDDEKVLVIVPAFNEERSIESVIGEIRVQGEHYIPIVIDDGSTDATRERARRAGARVVSLPANLGIGGAVQTGIRIACREGFTLCCQIDADGQHDASDIPRLCRELRRQGYDLVVGSRYANESGGDRSTKMRRFGSRVIRGTISVAFGSGTVSDPTSGFRLMGPRAIRLFAAEYPHDYPEPISLAVAIRSRLSVGEVPVSMRARVHGRSSINGYRSALYMFRVIASIWLARWRTWEQSSPPEGDPQ